MSQITFTQIPVGIKTPGVYVEINKDQIQQGILPKQNRKLLVLGQKLAAGTQDALSPVRVTSTTDAAKKFGAGSNTSIACEMILKVQPLTHLIVCASDDPSAGTQAVHTITFSNTATKSSKAHIQMGHQLSSPVDINIGDNATTIAATFESTINAQSTLSVSATSSAGVLTLTAKNKGVLGNISIKTLSLSDGVSATISQTTQGSGTLLVTDFLAAIGDEQYISIINPYNDDANMDAIETELAERFGPQKQSTGHVFTALSGTHADLITYGSSRNSPHSSCLGLKDSQTPEYITACIFAAACHQAGSIDPARPFQTLSLQGITPPSIENRFTQTERNLLLQNGISTSTTDNQGIQRLERVITTYQSDAQGLSDESYLDLNSKWTIDYIRFAINQRIAQTFPRHKLANDGTNFAPGQAIATPKIIKAEIIALLRDLEEHGLIEDLNGSVEQIEVIRNRDDASRVDASIPVDLINGMRVLAASLEFKL